MDVKDIIEKFIKDKSEDLVYLNHTRATIYGYSPFFDDQKRRKPLIDTGYLKFCSLQGYKSIIEFAEYKKEVTNGR